jgi:hypothetical protein
VSEPTEDPVDRAVRLTLDNWAELGIEEHEGVLHMPASIKRRNKTGGVDEVPVMLRNVTNVHKHRARVLARDLAGKMKLDLDRDRDLIEQIENYAILSYAVRDPKTYDQHVATAGELLERYDTQSLAELWGRYNLWVDMLDPRYGELEAEQLWRVIARIASEKNPSPLAGLAGFEQASCIVLMAVAASNSPTRPSWLGSPTTSLPGSSRQPSSEASSA